jgi:hypothetical protein
MRLDIYLTAIRPTQVYWDQITHNLGKMASAAGLYEVLWRPEELKITLAGDLIPLLEHGLLTLKASPEQFKVYNPENGWGSYDNLIVFVETYLEACRDNPDAEIRVSR